MTTHPLLRLLPILLLVALPGCPWNGLDEQADRAPVQVLVKDGDFVSTYGRVVVPLRLHGDDAPVSLVAAGQATSPLAIVELSATGNVRETRLVEIPKDQLIPPPEDRDGHFIRALVPLPPRPGASGVTARVLAGVPGENYVREFVFAADGTVTFSTPKVKADRNPRRFGLALAAGELDGDPTAPEWVIADEESVYVAYNEDLNDSTLEDCHYRTVPSGLAAPATPLALQAGRFVEADGTDRVSFAVGVPSATAAPAAVYVLRYVGGQPFCQTAGPVLAPPAGRASVEKSFGAALSAWDLNADGVDDLAVGSPAGANSRAYLFLSAGTPGDASLVASAVTEVTTAEANPVRFGATVLLADLTGDGWPELVVADPDAPYHGNSGRLHVFELTFQDTGAGRVLTGVGSEHVIGDGSEPSGIVSDDELKKATHSLGVALAPVSWSAGRAAVELAAGTTSERILVFYLTGLPGDDDPR
jgi:hypothetical protein